MKSHSRFAICVTLLLLSFAQLQTSSGSSLLPLSTGEQIENSDAVLRGKVVGINTARGADGLIYTRTSLRVDETLKGKLPAIVAVEHRGGQVGSEEEFYGLSPKLLGHGEYLLFVKRNAKGKLECTQGHASAVHLIVSTNSNTYESPGLEILTETRAIIAASSFDTVADVTDQAGEATILPQATAGMLGNVNTRFLQPDRGEPIPVLIDADVLPAGMTLAQATNAVIQALNAWVAVTSLKFKIESIGGFGQGADTIATPDEKLRIQLHDSYGRINTANVLGIGGRNASTSPSPAGWDIGGNVAGNEFYKSTYGYVVLEAGNSTLQNSVTFAEVLCHEIGHALNMAHSSEVNTSDPLLLGSIMYYQAHADGRGATLGSYDPPIIRQCYPSNTVPYTFHRVMDVTSAPAAITNTGINEVEVRGYDLQTANLTLATNSQSTANGTFTLTGSKIKFTPSGYFADSDRYDPDMSGGSYQYRGRIFGRFSDGTNASPYALIRVVSLRGEATFTPDGIPDYWMMNYFGSATPSAGNLSRATDDADGDGLSNTEEYRTGTNPKDATSRVRITGFTGDTLQFQAQGYELYEILGTTNLVNWSVIKAFSPTVASINIRTNLPQTNILATVSNLPTTGPKMFYRVLKVP
ncbi:MAG: hypothetical protein QM813_09840 [Verrucomicrobiota bacterium]